MRIRNLKKKKTKNTRIQIYEEVNHEELRPYGAKIMWNISQILQTVADKDRGLQGICHRRRQNLFGK